MVRRAEVSPGLTGMGEAHGQAIPFLASDSVLWPRPQGAGVAQQRGNGTLQALCFYKWELSNSAFFRLLSSILGALGGFNRLTGKIKACDNHSCLWCLQLKSKCGHLQRLDQSRASGSACWLGPGEASSECWLPLAGGKRPKISYRSCSSRVPCWSIPKLDLKAGFRPFRQHPCALFGRRSKSQGPKLHMLAEEAFLIPYSSAYHPSKLEEFG